ncbi:MAG: LPS export ABC transporter periplasmic protein LptC [Candidatus Hydrogenedentes bacterium]|nr:LPS export ABC transporter periplasmic protein LptC [Candidatus Hydrogenedentota bacterium]
MKRLAWIAALGLLAAGCDTPAPLPHDPVETASPGEETDAGESFSMEGEMTLRMFDNAPGVEESRKPSFVVTADCRMLKPGLWSLNKAYAVIYANDGTEAILRAGKGTYDEANNEAHMEGSVHLETATLSVRLEDLVWKNEERRAVTDRPVVVEDEGSRLEAASLAFYPDTDPATGEPSDIETTVLEDVTGTYSLIRRKN